MMHNSLSPPPLTRPEAVLVAVVRALFLSLENLSTLDLTLLSIITLLVAISLLVRNAGLYILRVVLVALGSLFAVVNSYVLAATWIPSITSPGPTTIAAVQVLNSLAPIVTDTVLLVHIIEDDIVRRTSLATVISKVALSFALKASRTGNAILYIVERVKLVLIGTDIWVKYPASLPLAISGKVGCALQLGDNFYSLVLFLHGMHKEGRNASSLDAPAITTSVLTSQSITSLVLLATTNFISPILLGSAQLAALLQNHDEDTMLPLYLECVKTLIQIVGAHSASFLVALQRRRNRLRAAAHAFLSEEPERAVGYAPGNNDDGGNDGPSGQGKSVSAQPSKIPHETTALRTSNVAIRSYSLLPCRGWMVYSKAFNPNFTKPTRTRDGCGCARGQ